MYKAFEAVVHNGKIEPLEDVRLREKTKVLVTIINTQYDDERSWNKLSLWLKRQRKDRKNRTYYTVNAAGNHLKDLMKK